MNVENFPIFNLWTFKANTSEQIRFKDLNQHLDTSNLVWVIQIQRRPFLWTRSEFQQATLSTLDKIRFPLRLFLRLHLWIRSEFLLARSSKLDKIRLLFMKLRLDQSIPFSRDFLTELLWLRRFSSETNPNQKPATLFQVLSKHCSCDVFAFRFCCKLNQLKWMTKNQYEKYFCISWE